MVYNLVIDKLKKLTQHDYLEIVTRGNSAIDSAVKLLSKEKKLLIPEEGGWLHYKTVPKMQGVEEIEVKCNNAIIDVEDLKLKLTQHDCSALLYQNPGGYFAPQDMEKIYQLCQENNCLVILDVSGSIGTMLCNGNYADIIIGSFGKWKLVEAQTGGFISTKSKELFEKLELEKLDNDHIFLINQKIDELPNRIRFLEEIKDKIINDFTNHNLEILYPDEIMFVIIIKYRNNDEMERVINYCKDNNLPWTECPRYIRLNDKAISIELKRL